MSRKADLLERKSPSGKPRILSKEKSVVEWRATRRVLRCSDTGNVFLSAPPVDQLCGKLSVHKPSQIVNNLVEWKVAKWDSRLCGNW